MIANVITTPERMTARAVDCGPVVVMPKSSAAKVSTRVTTVERNPAQMPMRQAAVRADTDSGSMRAGGLHHGTLPGRIGPLRRLDVISGTKAGPKTGMAEAKRTSSVSRTVSSSSPGPTGSMVTRRDQCRQGPSNAASVPSSWRSSSTMRSSRGAAHASADARDSVRVVVRCFTWRGRMPSTRRCLSR